MIKMTYEQDMKELKQNFNKWFANNPNPSKEDLFQWIKYGYIVRDKKRYEDGN